MSCPPPLRFFCVHTEAIEQTHQALQSLEQERQGSSRPSRALRVAQLYGHLQLRARENNRVQLGLKHLAETWHLQPRELRADLNDLQSLGWLSFTTDMHGTTIQLTEPEEAEQPQEEQPASGAATQRVEPFQVKKAALTDQALISQFSAIYNLHRPSTWPSHEPGNSPTLGRLVQQAIDRAGGREVFWSVLKQALKAMPAFWRTTYPQGRSGADCARALFRCDQGNEDLGWEFWHVFLWGEAALQNAFAASPQAASPQTITYRET